MYDVWYIVSDTIYEVNLDSLQIGKTVSFSDAVRIQKTSRIVSVTVDFFFEMNKKMRCRKINEKETSYTTRDFGGRLGNQLFEYIFMRLMAIQYGANFKSIWKFPAPFEKAAIMSKPKKRNIGLDKFHECMLDYPMDMKYFRDHIPLIRSFFNFPNLSQKYDVCVHVRLDDVFGDHPEYTALPFSYYESVFQQIPKKMAESILLIARPVGQYQIKFLQDLQKFIEKLRGGPIVQVQTGSITEDVLAIMQCHTLVGSIGSFWVWPVLLSPVCKVIYVPLFGQNYVYHFFEKNAEPTVIANKLIIPAPIHLKTKVLKDDMIQLYDVPVIEDADFRFFREFTSHIYIINLAHREDRRIHIRKQMEFLNIPTSQYSFVKATDRSWDSQRAALLEIGLAPNLVSRHGYFQNPNTLDSRKLSYIIDKHHDVYSKIHSRYTDVKNQGLAEVAVTLSHARIWHHIAQNGHPNKHYLILEDDACLTRSFATSDFQTLIRQGMKTYPKRDLFLLGYCFPDRTRTLIRGPHNSLQSGSYYCMHSYMMTPTLCTFFLSKFLPIRKPVDDLFNHKDVRERMLVFKDPIFYQNEETGVSSDIQRKDIIESELDNASDNLKFGKCIG